MSRIVGVDPSLGRTGVGLLEDGEVRALSIRTTKKDGSDYDRQRKIARELVRHLSPGDLVVFEDFGAGGRFQPSGKFVERLELVGMMKYVCPLRTRRLFLEVRPSHLKSFVAGKAAASKETVMTAVRLRWGCEVDNQDEADATALALVGAAVVNGNAHDLYGKRKVLEKIKGWKSNQKALNNLRANNQFDT